MPSSIPYNHPSLVLGNLVDTTILDLFQQINSQQVKITAAQEKMNGLLMMRRSLAMTISELSDLQIDVSSLKSEVSSLNGSLTSAAQAYLKTRISGEETIQGIREKISLNQPTKQVESPLDFSLSKIKPFPISSESIKLDSQYFSYEGKNEDDLMAGIESYIKNATNSVGANSVELGKTATEQIKQQKLNHTLSGTLIITASCTHKNASIIEPLHLDVDKALEAWNEYFPNEQLTDQLLQTSIKNSTTISDSQNKLALISGMTLGSSFIGMVHFLRKEETSIGPVDKTAEELQKKLQLGGWLQNTTGGFGMNPDLQQEVTKILNDQTVSCHVNLITMGAIPSITSNQLSKGTTHILQQKTANETLSLIESSDNLGDKNTVASMAAKARKGEQILKIEQSKVQSVIEGLGKIDSNSNKSFDINSLLDAFDNYLTAVKNGDKSCGAPLHFYLKKISKTQLVKLWKKKYYPITSGRKNLEK